MMRPCGDSGARLVAGIVFLLTALPIAGRAQPIVAAFERFHAHETPGSSLVEGGILLLNELNCVACHAAPEGWRDRLGGRGKISLAGVGDRLPAAALREFVRDPHVFKPGTIMPQVLMADDSREDALVAFLVSLASPEPKRSFPSGDAARGKRLFETVGCVACHSAAGTSTTYPSVPLALATHYDRDALASFLRDPLHSRPAGRMPATELTEMEAADLAAFLNPGRTVAARSDAILAPAGSAEFSRRGCAACHDTGDARPGVFAAPLAKMRTDRGCLATARLKNVPWFALSDRQRTALAEAIREIQVTPAPTPRTAEQALQATFEQLNCYACHQWRGKGGLEAARAKHFIAADSAAESLGEFGHLPPKLDQAGRKLTTEWLGKLLWGSGGGVRSYLTARMPRYGRENGEVVIPLLAEACRPSKPETIDTSGTKGHQRSATGRVLIGTGGNGALGCVACHGLNDREPPGVRAINLTHTAQRVQPEYFKALLLDPQGVQPGTIMPPLFAGRKNADKEIESLWTYLKELDQNARLPEGLAAPGSFELKPDVEGRPIVFRTFLEGAGTQAIAVGYPARMHAAFDALEVRWALVWRGRFLDALANWEERMMPPIKPLGDSSRMLALHMPLAALRTPDESWPAATGIEAGYVFKGYRLGSDGVPTFRYTIAGLEVDDVVRPEPDGSALRRIVTVRGGGGDDRQWFFRGVNDAVPRPLVWQNGAAVMEERITF